MKFRNVNNTLIAACEESAKFLEKTEGGEAIELRSPDRNAGSVNMLRTWRGWMNETAIAMNHWGCTMPLYVDSKGIPHGSRPYNAEDAHGQFTAVYLGTDENGKRKSWTMSRTDNGTVQASIGDRLWAMDMHLAWCTEKGIKLTIPRKSEYRKLKTEQGEAQAA